MKLSVQVVLHTDDGTETVVNEVFHLDRGPLTPDSLGLAEAKDLLAAVQRAPSRVKLPTPIHSARRDPSDTPSDTPPALNAPRA